ncbi:PREDICTED: complement C1q tumor necrosis factor-related protein 3-like [Branchiostoma belcheri]|uniref:Complement C1q tumor necrosis factor-related protein 3-like n=1 Tax=Branchiostoma belcheri TaxID=7741 RepID=A0A6P4YK70_BRABE|nr:PREDICTED: complement C1q tumor necrosis factor-related protein 3-like [Branchiostoma belcheri]
MAGVQCPSDRRGLQDGRGLRAYLGAEDSPVPNANLAVFQTCLGQGTGHVGCLDRLECQWPGQRGLPGPSPPAVAFFVALSSGTDVLAPVLAYDVIHTNVGGGYDRETGKFLATTRGVYTFTFTARKSAATDSRCTVSLVKNGVKIVSLTAQGGQTQASSSAVLLLRRTDQVWIMLSDGYLESDASGEATFSGVLNALEDE